jgi:hypothetical protein
MSDIQILDSLHQIPYDTIELEFRLGKKNKRHMFVAGTSEEEWSRAIKYCEQKQNYWTN